MIRSLRKMVVTATGLVGWHQVRGALFRKYVVLFVAVVSIALLTNGLVDIWFIYQEHRAALIRIQKEQADSAASKITQFIKEIEGQLGWTTHLSWSTATMEQRRLDGLRLLRQVPAITELSQLDGQGREQLRVSRLAMDRFGSNVDFSNDPKFTEALANKVYYGPVYFRRESEPFMTLAMAGSRPDAGVSVAEVDLKFIWDVVSQIRVGQRGQAFVVDAQGRLIAHQDFSLVLRKTDLSQLAQIKFVRDNVAPPGSEQVKVTNDIRGERVLTAHATAEPLNWLVFVELPEREANASLYATIQRSVLVLLAGLALAFVAGLFLAHRMMVPIRALSAGAARIGAGALDHRIAITTGDELEALGEQFNHMAIQLQSSYSTLERKIEERTHQLEVANLSKSRFLAAASHDLRQPLHALNLFAAQLRSEADQAERSRLAVRIDSAVAAMNELFNSILDISKLDAGVLDPAISEFPINHLLKRIEATFTAAARQKGLLFRVMPSSAWVRSDAILLERILLNLVSNAVRYTTKGGVVVGCRHKQGRLRVEVCDSGIGIPEDQQRNIFGEFYQFAATDRDRRGGLGLGLAIVERLCGLLDHPISLTSTLGKGSRFFIIVPMVAALHKSIELSGPPNAALDPARGKLIVVVDDDALVLDGMRGLLRSWGCRVVTAESHRGALSSLGVHVPDLIISDFRLKEGDTGIEVIALLRSAFHAPIPAFLISGDISPERLREASERGHHLLHKPVSPMTLRAMMGRLLKDGDQAGGSIQTAVSNDMRIS